MSEKWEIKRHDLKDQHGDTVETVYSVYPARDRWKRTIADVYSETNARLITKAPEMLEFLEIISGTDNAEELLDAAKWVKPRAEKLLKELEGK